MCLCIFVFDYIKKCIYYFQKLFYYKMYTKLVFKLDFTKIDILVFLFFILMDHCTFPCRPLWRALITTVVYFQKYLSEF